MLKLAARMAFRDLLRGFRRPGIFLMALALGVAAITLVGTLRSGIEGGILSEGSTLLGGDAEMRFAYRFASSAERAFMEDAARAVSEVVVFHSMAVADGAEALAEVKAVDDHWPLLGQATLCPDMAPGRALEVRDGVAGAAMAPVLIERLGLAIGDRFRLGTRDFQLRAALIDEPDAAAGFSFAPRVLVSLGALTGSGLLAPGALFHANYRLLLAPGDDLDAVKARAEALLAGNGLRWRDRRHALPGVERMIGNAASFLTLIGLAALLIGGIGIAGAVRAWLEGQQRTIATLKTLGATSSFVFALYLGEVLVLAAIGIVAGLIIGTAIPLALAPVIRDALPFPAHLAVSGESIAMAALCGLLLVLIFTLMPLARAERVRPGVLYRGGGGRMLPGWRWIGVWLLLVTGLLALVILTSDRRGLVAASAAGVVALLVLLALAGRLVRLVARIAARARLFRRLPTLRTACAAVAAPAGDTVPVIVSLGFGLAVLAAIGQIHGNLRHAIDRQLPDEVPAFFFIDIQPDQLAPFGALMRDEPSVTRVETAPMLRGIIRRINDRPAEEVAGEHWLLRGDHGVSFAETPPPGTRITAGRWWTSDDADAPEVSFSRNEAEEIGLHLGDTITVNILGRDITARVSSLREVDFARDGIAFVMIVNPAALAGAPHTSIATVHAAPAAEERLMHEVSTRWPNITGIPVRTALARLGGILAGIATAAAWAAGVTLLAGLVVLVGTAAAGQGARIREAAILKTLGATRGAIRTGFALRAALTGLAAGVIAIMAGGIGGWLFAAQVLAMPYRFEPLSALGIVLGGMLATLIAGLLFDEAPLRARPARVLRHPE